MEIQTALSDALELFLLDAGARRLTKRSRYFYQTSLQLFVTWCAREEVTRVGDVTTAHLRRYQVALQERRFKGRPLSATYQYNLVRALRTFFAFCVAEGLIVRTPFQNIRLPKLEKKVLQALTPNEVRRVLRACDYKRDRAIVMFLLDTGLRAAELCALNVGDVDLAAGMVHVHKGKGQKGRIVYAGARSCKAVKLYLLERGHLLAMDPLFAIIASRKRVTVNGLVQMMRRLQQKTGIKHCACHTMRRTFAITCLRNGMNVHLLAKLMGHADIGILRQYLDIVEADLQQAHESYGPMDHMQE